ncbi:hypothetical protein IFR05_016950 [Cadophora sp. M221]|nr:hypothetical protein IFR05_016950 [Cadophora sp. M221]
MACLLVNLELHPEMLASFFPAYHTTLWQAYEDQMSLVKSSDRLKSMLKDVPQGPSEPNTLEKIKSKKIPRTNPVNLIFVLVQFAQKVTELHFSPNGDFYDLIMKEDVACVSRAKAFLWLMWFYLESDFVEKGAKENPFGPGVDYGVDGRNQGVPRFDYLTKDKEEAENVDTQEEKEYGLAKMGELKRIQAEHDPRPQKRGPKPKSHVPRRNGRPKRVLLILNTGTQFSAERARNQRFEHTIARGLRRKHSSARKKREQQGALWRASQRLKQMRNPFDDSEEDGDLSIPPLSPFRTQGFGGLMQLKSEDDDFGEEVSAYAAAFRCIDKVLDPRGGQRGLHLGVIDTNGVSHTYLAPANCHNAVRDADKTEGESSLEGNKLGDSLGMHSLRSRVTITPNNWNTEHEGESHSTADTKL